jgi:hypothetical protein
MAVAMLRVDSGAPIQEDSHYCWSMIFSDLPSPAEASSHWDGLRQGFAQAGNRRPLFGIMF